MAYPALVNLEFEKSEMIVSALEDASIPVTVAMWVHFPEYEDWRFILAAKKLDPMDLGDAYLKVNALLRTAGLTVWNKPTVQIMRTTDPFIRALRKSYKDVKDISGVRLGGQSWGDRYIDDAFAYKIA